VNRHKPIHDTSLGVKSYVNLYSGVSDRSHFKAVGAFWTFFSPSQILGGGPSKSYIHVITLVWLGGVVVGRRISDREVASSIPGCSASICNSGQVVHTHMCLCAPSSINWYRLRLGVKCTTGAVLGMLAAIRRTLRLAANRRHSNTVLTCGCRCTAALK